MQSMWCSVFKIPYKILYPYIYPGSKKPSPGFHDHRKVNPNGPEGLGIALDGLYDSNSHVLIHRHTEM